MTEPMKPSVTLLPCPFCDHRVIGMVRMDATNWFAECNRCGASRLPEMSEPSAITAWNTRASSTASSVGADELDDVRKFLADFAVADLGEGAADAVTVGMVFQQQAQNVMLPKLDAALSDRGRGPLYRAAQTLRTEALLNLNNSIGCAQNHYGHDCEQFGLPQWIADSEQRINDATAALSATPAQEVDETERLRRATMACVDAMRDHIVPDGISADEAMSRIIGALDNPEINPIILEADNARS